MDTDKVKEFFLGLQDLIVERLARIGKLASDAGIDERRLRLDALVLDRLGFLGRLRPGQIREQAIERLLRRRRGDHGRSESKKRGEEKDDAHGRDASPRRARAASLESQPWRALKRGFFLLMT